MTLPLQIVSSHPLFPLAVFPVFNFGTAKYSWASPSCHKNWETLSKQNEPCLEFLDTCALPAELAMICRVLRARCPGSRFLAFLDPGHASDDDVLRLVYQGVSGCVCLEKGWQEESLQAVTAIHSGKLWFAPHVLRRYVTHTNYLLEQQIRPDNSLTAREQQILQWVLRRMSNKEIAAALEISERTVKFHVSNILLKFRVNGRRDLLHEVDVQA